MTLEQQTVSLPIAQKLKELGVKQESLCCWYTGTKPATLWREDALEVQSQFFNLEKYTYAAFTVAELGELLTKANYNWQTAKFKNGRWFIADYVAELPNAEADTEADARGKMLVYLLENKLITLP
jgi:uncharacterized protein YaeQ